MISIALSLMLIAQPVPDAAAGEIAETPPPPVEAAEPPPQPYVPMSPTAHELYAPPRIRPFEPPREMETGDDGSAAVVSQASSLETPADVERYSGHYEAHPSARETAYLQGMTSARLRTESQMGPLDGRWRVTGADGGALFEILLMDRGGGRLVEGAWRALTASPAAAPSVRAGALSMVVADGDALILGIARSDNPQELRLIRDGQQWRGVLREGDRTAGVIMERTP